MDEVIARALLAATAATLVLEVERLRRAYRLRVNPLARDRCERWVLVEAGRSHGLDARLSSPADRSAVHVVDVEDLGAAVDDALFQRIAEVAADHGRGGITK